MRIDDILAELDHRIDRLMLEDFIARGWVRPARDDDDFVFEAVDIARVQLICELHEDMALEDDTLELVLSLLDRLYDTRARLHTLAAALQSQPENVRDQIRRVIEKD